MLCKNGNICNKVTIFSHDFFPACTLALYDDVKCQDTNRDTLSNNLYCSHLQILYAHIQNQGVSPWIPHTRVWVILEEHDVEWSNPMSSKIRREKTVVEKGRKNWLQAGCDSSHSYWLADCSEKRLSKPSGTKRTVYWLPLLLQKYNKFCYSNSLQRKKSWKNDIFNEIRTEECLQKCRPVWQEALYFLTYLVTYLRSYIWQQLSDVY